MTVLIRFYTSTSLGEAQSSAKQLTDLVQQVLESNLEISQRMASLEMRTLGNSQSLAPTLKANDIDAENNSIHTIKDGYEGNEDMTSRSKLVETQRSIREAIDQASTDIHGSQFSFTFDQDLRNSRPYARTMKRNSVISTASSTIHTMGWSCLSGVSLADVSEISVIALPISPQELWNSHHYLSKINMQQVSRDSPALKEEISVNREDSTRTTFDTGSLETRSTRPSLGSKIDLSLGDKQERAHSGLAGERPLKVKKVILLGIIQTALIQIDRPLIHALSKDHRWLERLPYTTVYK